MKEWLRVLPLPVLVFCVLTALDLFSDPVQIRWLYNIGHALLLGAIGCVGQYLIHKNILKEDPEDPDEDNGCMNCGRF